MAFLFRLISQFTPLICNRPESDLLVALVYPVMLQFLSTIELPMRFGHPPDSRKMMFPNFFNSDFFQPAANASSGNHEISPCLKGDFTSSVASAVWISGVKATVIGALGSGAEAITSTEKIDE